MCPCIFVSSETAGVAAFRLLRRFKDTDLYTPENIKCKLQSAKQGARLGTAHSILYCVSEWRRADGDTQFSDTKTTVKAWLTAAGPLLRTREKMLRKWSKGNHEIVTWVERRTQVDVISCDWTCKVCESLHFTSKYRLTLPTTIVSCPSPYFHSHVRLTMWWDMQNVCCYTLHQNIVSHCPRP